VPSSNQENSVPGRKAKRCRKLKNPKVTKWQELNLNGEDENQLE